MQERLCRARRSKFQREIGSLGGWETAGEAARPGGNGHAGTFASPASQRAGDYSIRAAIFGILF